HAQGDIHHGWDLSVEYWEDLGGLARGQIAAASAYTWSVDLFIQGTDQNIWRRSWPTSPGGTAPRTWSGWQPVTGDGSVDLDSPLVALARPQGPVDNFLRDINPHVFYRRTDSALGHASLQAPRTVADPLPGNWVTGSIGGSFTGSLAA